MHVTVHLKRPTREPVRAARALQSRGNGALAPLFGLAPGGVCRATECCHRRGALLPHPFTLTGTVARTALRRFAFCCTFRGLAPPRRYLAPCPGSPDFPPRLRAAIVWPTPAYMVGANRPGYKPFRYSSFAARPQPRPRIARSYNSLRRAPVTLAAIFAACDGGSSSSKIRRSRSASGAHAGAT